MTTTSTQRSNLRPTPVIVPTCVKPQARCTPIELGVGRVADDREHFAQPEPDATCDQLLQQQLAETAAHRFGRKVKRVLDRVSIGRARSEVVCVGVADNAPGRVISDQIWKA